MSLTNLLAPAVLELPRVLPSGRNRIRAEAGAIRDVVQNHMLQVVASLAMECPAARDHEVQRGERARVHKAIRTLGPTDVVRGQFRGYRREPGVAPDSQVETFAAARFHVDNERWKGVPFFVRVGKCLPVTATEALVQFKRPPRPVLDETVLAMTSEASRLPIRCSEARSRFDEASTSGEPAYSVVDGPEWSPGSALFGRPVCLPACAPLRCARSAPQYPTRARARRGTAGESR